MTRYKKHNNWVYAVYKGDNFLCEGTREEICNQLGIKRNTFGFYRSNYYKKNRITRLGKAKIIIRIDAKDKIWG
jgi:hypothetical protein